MNAYPKSINERKDITEYLFIDRGKVLDQLNCHKIYTLPINLVFSDEIPNLIAGLGCGFTPRILPMIPIKYRNDLENEKGMNLLRQMVMARAYPYDAEEKRLTHIEDVFDSSKTLDRLCKISGGHIRNLLRILCQSIINEGATPSSSGIITNESLEKAIKIEKNNRRLIIKSEHDWELLADVAKHKRLIPSQEYQRLLKINAVLEYDDGEGKWFDVDPILAETNEFNDKYTISTEG